MFRPLKLSGAFLLVLGLFLPLSSCSHFEDEKGNNVSSSQMESLPPDVREVKDYQYALDDYDPEQPFAWLLPLTFIWPLLFVGLFMWLKHGPIVTALRFAEPFLLAASTYVILTLAALGEQMEIGGYIALIALGAYAIATVWEDVLCLSAWWEDRRHTSFAAT